MCVYPFARVQHVPVGGHAADCLCPSSVFACREGQRALPLAHERWVAAKAASPSDRFPRVGEGGLQASAELAAMWPAIPGADWVPGENEHRRLWFGPKVDEDDESGVMIGRPRVGRHESRLLVPAVHSDGNERAGIRSANLQAPLGTYAGWNMHREGYGVGDLCGLSGSFLPFPATAVDRLASGDPRPSLEERYGDHDGYVAAIRAATVGLVAEAAASDVLR